MQLTRSRSSLWILVISLTVSIQAQSGPPESSSKIVDTNLAFPSPVQWAADGAEISLMHVAWGPANSPEMLSKGRQKMGREQAAFYPDRPYVLALGFSAKSVAAVPATSYSTSGLVRVKDTDGDIEVPMVLTPDGFVPFFRFSGCLRRTLRQEHDHGVLGPVSCCSRSEGISLSGISVECPGEQSAALLQNRFAG
jgi:hypothetical protein